MNTVRATPEIAPPTPKRPRGRPRKTVDARDDGNRRQVLLAAAAQLFRRQGFVVTTTRDIAAAADMQSGSPFYHFKSKDALWYAVMEEGMRRALARQQATLQAPAGTTFTPREQLRILVQVHLDVLLGPGNDFVPVMLYEARSLALRQRKSCASSTYRLRGSVDTRADRVARGRAVACARQAGALVDFGCTELVGAMV